MDGNLNALEIEQDRLERNEARYNRAVKEFRDAMDASVDILVGVFNSNCVMYDIDRSELRAILIEDIGEVL